jgi:hypothetical protein
MSYHVYIARRHPQPVPISEAEWVEAARQCPALEVTVAARTGAHEHHAARLVAERRQWLTRTPQGLLHAQGPSSAMVTAMFELAGRLDATVLSEHMRPYDSIADWAQRSGRRLPSNKASGGATRSWRRWRWPLAALVLTLLGSAAAAAWWLTQR